MKWDKTQEVCAGVNSFSPTVSHVIGAVWGFSGFPVRISLQNGDVNDLRPILLFQYIHISLTTPELTEGFSSVLFPSGMMTHDIRCTK